MTSCERTHWAAEAGRLTPSEYGDEQSNSALTDEQIRHAANYHYDVWAGGYNWVQSNKISGSTNNGNDTNVKNIGDYINDILRQYAAEDKAVDKVILVTHSMGGLVSRALTEIHRHPKVLGVVHGAQPATGAPTAYKVARTGYDGVESVILGRDAAEVVAVMAISSGAMELLPSADYNEGKPWLKIPGANGTTHTLPKSGDPYTEIYQSTDWYGLIPQYNRGLMEPGTPPGDQSFVILESETSEELLYSKINEVCKFHESIQKKYHTHTYITFGDDAHDAFKTYGEVEWACSKLSSLEITLTDIASDRGKGVIRLQDQSELRVAGKNMSGDGTVPKVSAEAPGKAGVLANFRHGDQGKGDLNLDNKKEKKGYGHQQAYGDLRTMWATLYSVIRIANDAAWHE